MSLLLGFRLRRNNRPRCLDDILQPPANLLEFIFSHVVIEILTMDNENDIFSLFFVTEGTFPE